MERDEKMKRCPVGKHRENKKCVDTLEYELVYMGANGKWHWYGDYSKRQLPEAEKQKIKFNDKYVFAEIVPKSEIQHWERLMVLRRLNQLNNSRNYSRGIWMTGTDGTRR